MLQDGFVDPRPNSESPGQPASKQGVVAGKATDVSGGQDQYNPSPLGPQGIAQVGHVQPGVPFLQLGNAQGAEKPQSQSGNGRPNFQQGGQSPFPGAQQFPGRFPPQSQQQDPFFFPQQFQTQPGQFQTQPGQFQGQIGQIQGQPGQFQGQPIQFQGQPGQFPGQSGQFPGQFQGGILSPAQNFGSQQFQPGQQIQGGIIHPGQFQGSQGLSPGQVQGGVVVPGQGGRAPQRGTNANENQESSGQGQLDLGDRDIIGQAYAQGGFGQQPGQFQGGVVNPGAFHGGQFPAQFGAQGFPTQGLHTRHFLQGNNNRELICNLFSYSF